MGKRFKIKFNCKTYIFDLRKGFRQDIPKQSISLSLKVVPL